MSAFGAKTQGNLSPPRMRIEYAVLGSAADAKDDLTAMGNLSDAVRARRTTPRRLLEAARGEIRLRRRAFLIGVLTDASEGTCSTLELEYLRRVERAHGLPSAARQVRDSLRGTVYRDVEYVDYGLIVELDGQLGHTSTRDRDDDMERDLDAALTSRTTVRLGWGQVHERACSSARKIALLLRQRGWTGEFRPCRHCKASDVVDISSAGDEKSTMSVA